MFISKKYQNKGLGSQIMKLVEGEFPLAVEWVLDTPHLNSRNHHFYEKIGYKKIGQHQINEKLILIDYTKKIK
ncbi:GNAT family N-acetyltransferase [Lysinibacillus sp. NPDC092081]|uniref:GNAT family N-acetyltransferase n=1 Tax=Lysinibacillus sp. NPDC092081 TaxID=3364131 RepID=UPI00381C03B8